MTDNTVNHYCLAYYVKLYFTTRNLKKLKCTYLSNIYSIIIRQQRFEKIESNIKGKIKGPSYSSTGYRWIEF